MTHANKDAVHYRQSGMFLQGQHFGRVAAMANGRVPFAAAAAQANADLLAVIAKLPWAGFATGETCKSCHDAFRNR